jgi:hypothetical protein
VLCLRGTCITARKGCAQHARFLLLRRELLLEASVFVRNVIVAGLAAAPQKDRGAAAAAAAVAATSFATIRATAAALAAVTAAVQTVQSGTARTAHSTSTTTVIRWKN